MTARQLKEQFERRAPLVGLFVRTAAACQIEILGMSGLDMICLDAEHAVFDRSSLDTCLLAAKAAGLNCLVRVPAIDQAAIMQSLDMGAAGIVAPHVRSQTDAANLARLCRFGAGGRGFASSPRAADYGGRTAAEHISASHRETTILGILEDPEAFENLDEIMSVDGIDGFVLGLSDLSVAIGASSREDERIEAACQSALRAGRRYRRSVGFVVSDVTEAANRLATGANFFLVGSDHRLILDGARNIRQRFVAVSGVNA